MVGRKKFENPKPHKTSQKEWRESKKAELGEEWSQLESDRKKESRSRVLETLDDEEIARRKELNRVRCQRYREKKSAQKNKSTQLVVLPGSEENQVPTISHPNQGTRAHHSEQSVAEKVLTIVFKCFISGQFTYNLRIFSLKVIRRIINFQTIPPESLSCIILKGNVPSKFISKANKVIPSPTED